jgi:hypothetical protein
MVSAATSFCIPLHIEGLTGNLILHTAFVDILTSTLSIALTSYKLKFVLYIVSCGDQDKTKE